MRRTQREAKLHLLSAFLAGDLRQWRLALRKLLLRGRWQQSLPDRLLPSELAGPADGLRFFARLSLRRLLIGASLFHFSEDALALHLLLQNTKRLVDIVVPDKYLQLKLLTGAAKCASPACSQLRRSLVAIMRMRITAYFLRRPRTSRPSVLPPHSGRRREHQPSGPGGLPTDTGPLRECQSKWPRRGAEACRDHLGRTKRWSADRRPVQIAIHHIRFSAAVQYRSV